MRSRVLFILALTSALARPAPAQILVSEMGNLMYYNSLDSARSAVLNHIALRTLCFLQLTDSSHNIHLKLDLDITSDSSYYLLRYDNLTGTAATFSDSALTVADHPIADLGLYIKARDSTLDQDRILRMLDYGIRHYMAFQKTRAGDPPPDPAILTHWLSQKISPRLRRLLQACR